MHRTKVNESFMNDLLVLRLPQVFIVITPFLNQIMDYSMSSLALNTTPTLKSYPPDLEVIVGDDGDGAENEKKSFMYHGAMLANASEYIDTMLSLPMKEQQTRSISFPDIQPEEWLKWTQYVLVPGAAFELNLFNIHDVDNSKNAINIIQFYDKYQFRSGINLIDSQLSQKMNELTFCSLEHSASDYSAYEFVIELMLRICNDEIDLPLSKGRIPEFIASINYLESKSLLLEQSEANVKLILPYLFKIKDDYIRRSVISGLVDLVEGVSIHGRSLEEMKLISEEHLFVSSLKTKVHDIGHNEDLLSYFDCNPDKICVDMGEGNDNVINGEYKIRQRNSCIKLGVMDKWYVLSRYQDNQTFVIQSMDGQGSTWTISSHDSIGDRTGGSPICLYKWHKGGNITSLLPPKYGWEVPVVKSVTESRFDINFGSILDVNAKKIRITYSIR